jgi:hypothetical protein
LGDILPPITDGIDAKTRRTPSFSTSCPALAQMERELIIERTRAGLEAARSEGSGDNHFAIDEEEIKTEAGYDGLWVMRSNTVYNAETSLTSTKHSGRSRTSSAPQIDSGHQTHLPLV